MSPSSSRTAPGSISLRSGARASPRLRVPIGEELAARWMFHCTTLPRACLGGTHLSRFRARAFPWFVVQDGLCSVHAADAIWPLRRRLCVVNVKLTTQLGDRGAACVEWNASGQRRLISSDRRGWYTGGVKQFGHRAGRGGDVIPAPQGAKRSARQGRAFSAPSLFLCRLCTCTVQAKPPIWADIASKAARRLEGLGPLGIPARIPSGPAAGHPARADPDAAGRADGLCRADRGHSFAGAAAAGTRKLDHRRLRFHSEALRFDAARHHLSRRRRRQGLDLRHLFAAARQSQPYRLQRAVAVAVRQRAGAPVRRCQVFRVHGGDGGGRRAGASAHP